MKNQVTVNLKMTDAMTTGARLAMRIRQTEITGNPADEVDVHGMDLIPADLAESCRNSNVTVILMMAQAATY